MKQVLKFKLLTSRTCYAPMPVNAEILHVHAQGKDICLWALCDTKVQNEARKFHVLGTGHDYDQYNSEKHKYVGTVQMHDGALVWHVFEEHP